MKIKKTILFGMLPSNWVLKSGSRDKKYIYLTFDDGPNEKYTSALLSLLSERGIKASFFVTGDHVSANPELLQNIVDQGHDIYNHSFDHWEFEKFPVDKQVEDIKKLDKLLPSRENCNTYPFRPPRGKLSLSLLFQLVKAGRQVIYWSYDSLDYKQISVEYLVNRFRLNPVKEGDIILFHDDNSYTIAALPMLIENWLKDGFEIMPISQLINS